VRVDVARLRSRNFSERIFILILSIAYRHYCTMPARQFSIAKHAAHERFFIIV